MKLGFVVQRYGLEVAGGAELHCRLVAEHLAQHHTVEVFTTCARDYVSWTNEYPRGKTRINNVTVHRFPVRRTRNIRRFEDVQNLVFHERQSEALENRWLRENGPYCPALLKQVIRRRDIDAWILFSYRYWTTAECLRYLTRRALLVPTAEHDPALYLGVVRELFHLPAAIVYNSPEERALIQSISGNESIPGDTVGVGLVEQDPDAGDPTGAAERFKTMDPYILYIGRIDKNKGCDHLFRMFQRYCREVSDDVTLAMIGKSVMPIPDHPRICHLGFLSETEKTVALRHSRLLVMPSQYESLSMVLLEAWKYARPALVNGRCEVLDGQCRRSNGGLPYRNYDEFSEALSLMLSNASISETLGRNGHAYYSKHYNWPVIEAKYDALLSRVCTQREEDG